MGPLEKAGYIRGLPSWLTLSSLGSTRAEQRGGAEGSGADHGRLRARPELLDPTLMRKGWDLISPLERWLRTGGGGGGEAGLETDSAAIVPAGGQRP